MPKGQRKKVSQSESQEVQDIMAWGNKKENYYKDSQEEYSNLSEEELQAKKIYDNQFQEIQNQQLYQLPRDDEEVQDNQSEIVEDDKQLSYQYFTKEIKRMTKLALKVSQQRQNKVKNLLETYVQTYLMSLISLRQLKIPHIQYHPILNKILQLKQDIDKLKIAFDHLSQQETNSNIQLQEQQQGQNFGEQEEEEEDQQQENQGNEQLNNHQLQKGMQLYQEAKTKLQQQKKVTKKNKHRQRQAKKKPAFLQVKGNQGRLANEKILKNKGLVKKRKKIDRNGRVKLRRKFDKATSKRRAHGHFIRQNPGRQYEGQRNIKTAKIASVKIK